MRSPWESLGAATDYAYPSGGHASAMKYAQPYDPHSAGGDEFRLPVLRGHRCRRGFAWVRW
ncbi:hypothetical protein CH293_05610 [Rhodococcus sp. 14-2470-1b]|nr:hypothetical protein CH293_05610 [Rhodococcus sp. 14-2470-1b]